MSNETDDYEEEVFFNSNSYNSFITKNNIEILGDDMYTNNNMHRIDVVVPKDKRITSEIMTLAEFTRVISERAKQIENGSPIFCEINGETNLIKIAELEIALKCCPMKVTRYLTASIKEVWDINEMVAPFK
jgi:DNA-directed RNA polymerase subunit K/omega